MTGHEGIQSDYFDVHYGQLTALAQYAEQLVGPRYTCVTVEQPDSQSEGRIVAGNVTATAIQAAFEEPEEAEEFARLQNSAELRKAQVSFLMLQAHASLAWQVKQGTLSETTKTDLLTYTHAEGHTIYPSEELEVAITKLHGVNHLGEVSQYHFRAIDGPVKHLLTMTVIGEQINSLDATVKPREDEAFKRWVEILGTYMADLLPVLTGSFDSEEELDVILSNVRAQFVGLAHEEVMTPLLDEIRIRAITAKEVLALRAQIDPAASLPSADTLDAWQDRLSSL